MIKTMNSIGSRALVTDAGNTQATAKNLGDQTYDVVKLGVLTQQEISETVGEDDPADFFKFSVTQANALYLDLSATANTKFQVLNSVGALMGTMSAGSSSGSFKYMINLDVGTYYLKAATADSSEKASYIVKTLFAPTDTQHDSLAAEYYGSGGIVKLGSLGGNGTLTQTGTTFLSFGLYGQNYRDTYTFKLTADANVKFDLSALKNLGYTSLGVSSENGSSLGDFDISNYGKETNSIVKQLLAGTYTITIQGYGLTKTDSATGISGTAPTKYELKITTGTGNLDISGTIGNDIFNNGPGNDTIDGAGGVDTVVYSGLRASATVTKTSTGHTVSGPEGVDTLISIERLQFADKTLALDIDGNAGQAYRIYQAAFDRTPDNDGLKFWIGEMDNGTSLYSVADGFVHSAEFMAMYGANPSTAQFVTKLYNNVLHRQYDQGGYDYWTGVLDRNEATKTQVLASFSESPENQAGVIGVIQNGIELL